MYLTEVAHLAEITTVRSGRELVLIGLLAIQPAWLFAASYASYPNPVGEKVYAAGTLRRMVPVAIIAGGFSLAWLLNKVRSKARQRAVDNAGSHHG